MTKRFRIGVAGAGVFGGHHAAKYAAHPRSALVSVFDLDRTRAHALSLRHGAQIHDNYSAFLDSALDGVIIATPATTHYEMAREALERGLNVFIEKPLALDVEKADELICLAKIRGLTLQVGHQERYVAAAFGLFDRSLPPLKIDCVRSTRASGRCEDISVVMDLMVHDLDLIRHLARAEIATVTARGCAHETEAELKLTNGAIVSLNASRRAASPQRRMTLVYEDGVIDFDFIARELSNSTPHVMNMKFDLNAAPLAICDPLAFGAEQFIIAISGASAPIVTGEDGREALAWAQRIETAAGIKTAALEPALAEKRQRA